MSDNVLNLNRTARIRHPRYDLTDRPFLVIWEITQACDLACLHCRASAQPKRHPKELTTEQGFDLLDQVAGFGKPRPLLVLSGGDPFKREDLFDLVHYAADLSLPVSVSPSATPSLNKANLQRLHDAGAVAISLSLDGATANTHDTFRGTKGSFETTVRGIELARSVGLRFQLNTTVTPYNLYELADLCLIAKYADAMTWSVFFLVPTGRGTGLDQLTSRDFEDVLNFLYDAAKIVSLKTTEAPHYRRVVLQRQILEHHGVSHTEALELGNTYRMLSARLALLTSASEKTRVSEAFNGLLGRTTPIDRYETVRGAELHEPLEGSSSPSSSDDLTVQWDNSNTVKHPSSPHSSNPIDGPDLNEDQPSSTARVVKRSPLAINAGNGFVFISHLGEVFPSGFLPVPAGNVIEQPLADIYRNSPLFCRLRDPDALAGKCGRCEFRYICGGSRSRAYGSSGDPMGEEKWCSYRPGTFLYPEELDELLSAPSSKL